MLAPYHANVIVATTAVEGLEQLQAYRPDVMVSKYGRTINRLWSSALRAGPSGNCDGNRRGGIMHEHKAGIARNMRNPNLKQSMVIKMTSAHNSSVASADSPPLLEKALEKCQIVKDKIEGCALELFTVNETVKKEMTAGITLQQAKKALTQSEGVEDKVQECADELHVVNKVLAKEIEDRHELNQKFVETERKLSAARNILSNMADVLTVAHKVAEEATQRSLHDPVTGIPNRQLFSEHLEKAIALAQRGGWILGVMFIDLDGFKPINDTHGHAIGDKVLQEVAQRLQEQLRSGDTACRYGGDEFLYLLVNPQNIENVESIALKVLARISQTMIFNDLTLTIKPSIGIAVYPDGGNTGQELVANADAAMYRAKKTKTGIIFFNEVKDRAAGDARSIS